MCGEYIVNSLRNRFAIQAVQVVQVKENKMSKTLQEKIEAIQSVLKLYNCSDNTDENCVMLSSVRCCLQDALSCIGLCEYWYLLDSSKADIYSKAANMWIEKAAQHLWGFNRPIVW